jgi:glutamyl-tRNA reductase
MSVLAVGLSHRTAELTMLERVAVTATELPKLLHKLQQAPDITEVMVLSTCNRTEVYAVVETFHGGLTAVSEALAEKAGVPCPTLHESLYVHYAGAAIEHLFSVASGLDSMVVGETQILGQVRAAYAAAHEAGTVGSALHGLVQRTLRVGKRVHSETALGSLGASVVSEALAAAGDLAGRTALVVGAGSMGALAASQLVKAGVRRIVVANRTFATAERLVQNIAESGADAAAVGLSEVPQALLDADVAVSCTGAKGVVIGPEHVRPREKDLVICDLGMPRDVDSAVERLPGVRIVDLETVRDRMDRAGDSSTAKHIAQASGIVLDEVRDYLAEQRTAAVTPTVAALRQQAAEVVDAELLRLDRRLPDLDPQVRQEVARTVRRVVDKLLHTPTVRVKQLAAGGDRTDYAQALRELFGLDPSAPAVVSQPGDRDRAQN